ncbi:MAG TPA: SAM-dependent chlorinase/fluorinase [Vicinamibacterales bacterium]
MQRPVVALLTDFGTRDHYVGAMKGVVLGICPEATLVDITHEIPPQDIHAAAFELAAAWQYFPPGTVFLVVVDPGVGTGRRALAARAGGCRFVGPDNGVLAPVLRTDPEALVVELTESRFALPQVSRTFEGRDRFAPAAAWLARGTAVEALGPQVTDWRPLDVPEPRVDGQTLHGVVQRVDRFGNLVTNIHRAALDGLGVRVPGGGPAAGRTAALSIGGRRIDGISGTYADVAPGALCALVGSSGWLEIAVNGGNAADRLGLGAGAAVRIDVS